MALGGLLASVMKSGGGAYADIAKGEYEKQGRIDYAKQISEMEKEKQLYIDKITRERNIADIPLRTAATAEANLAAAPLIGRATAATSAAQLQEETDSGTTELRRSIKANDIMAETKARSAAEMASTKEQAADTKFTSALRTLNDAKASESERNNAARSAINLGLERVVADLRRKLSNTSDQQERQKIQQRIADLSGGAGRNERMADVVSAATNWRIMAKDLRKDAENVMTSPEEREEILSRAKEYEVLADSIQRTVIDIKLPGAATRSAGESAPAKSSHPASRQWNVSP